MSRKSFLITFDVEEFDLPRELGRPSSAASECDVTAAGLERILPLLARHAVRATFFITARFAEARPDSIREIVAAGHEPASHGLDHGDDYGRMDPALASSRLRRGRELLEQATGRPVVGVRTPRLRPCPPAVLRAAGFAYDASPHPTWVPGRYNGLHLPRTPWCAEGLVRVPISVLPFVRAPVSWVWYRSAGPLAGIAVRMAGHGARHLHLYFHPWEALPLREYGVPWFLAARSGEPFLRALDGLLAWAVRNLRPQTIADFVRDEARGGGLARVHR